MTLARPYKCTEVRDDYWSGTWDYARGKPAEKHRRYAEALKLAITIGPRPFSPWWIRTWQDVEAVLSGCYFQEWPDEGQRRAPGERTCAFFDTVLKLPMEGIHGEKANRPFVLMDWHRWDIVMPAFGWRRADGTRRFREMLIWVPKKNAKSMFCSGLELYFLVADGVYNASVFTAAESREQASLIHDEAANMVAASEWLSKRLEVINHTKTITYSGQISHAKALAHQSGQKKGVVQGKNWNALLFDEVHTQVDATYFDSLKYGGVARQQSMLVEISTSGVYDVTAVGWTEFERMIKIHTGQVKNSEVFTYYAHADEKEDWQKPATHRKANPAIDITIKAEDLVTAAKSASDNPKDLNEFLRYRLNRWVHTRERLVKPEDWESCACTFQARETFRESLKGRSCYGGMDLSLSQDITAFALLFPELADTPASCLTWFWLPKDTILEAGRKNNVPYQEWANQGFMKLTPGNVVDYQVVEDDIEEIMKSYPVKSIGFDPKFANQITSHMIAKHGEDFAFIVSQSALTMGPPTKFVTELIIKHSLIHEDNPILNWHVSNAQAYSRAGNVIVMKDERGKRFKVDGFIALIIAAQRAMCAPPEPEESAYSSRGILSLADLKRQFTQPEETGG